MTEGNENLPRLSDDAITIIWNAAEASNSAWDDWKHVQSVLLEDNGYSSAGGYDDTIRISEEARDVAFNFKMLTDIAGLAMRMSNSPFKIEPFDIEFPEDEEGAPDNSLLEDKDYEDDIPF